MAEKISKGTPHTKEFLEALRVASLPLQMAMLRQHYGISQLQLAGVLNLKQAYLSRLEREGANHLASQYIQVAAALRARLVLVPFGTRLTDRET